MQLQARVRGKNRRFILLVCSFIGIVTVSCQQENQQQDGYADCKSFLQDYPRDTNVNDLDMSLVTGEPCQPPCWQGLIPGVSTRTEAIGLLESASFVDAASIYVEETIKPSIPFEIEWTMPSSEWRTGIDPIPRFGTIGLNIDNTIAYIEVQLQYALSVRDITEIIGQPNGYFVQSDTIDRPSACSHLELVWIEQGFAAITGQATTGHPLEPLTLVTTVRYYSPSESAEDYLQIFSFSYSSSQMSNYRLWEGLENLVVDR